MGIAFVLVAAISWGTGGAVAAGLYDSSGLGPLAVSFWRYLLGVALLAAARRWFRGREPFSAGWRQVLATGIGFAVYQTAYYASIEYAGLAIGTVVTLGTGPIIIAVGARLFLREGTAGPLTLLACLGGLVLLVARPETGSNVPLGVGLALLSAAGYAFVTLLTRASTAGDDPYDTALGGFVVGGVCLAPLAVGEGLLPTSGEWTTTVAGLLFLGAVPTALAYGLFFAGLATVRATTASVVALVEPVTGALLAVVCFGERLGALGWTGGALLMASVAALAVGETRRTAISGSPRCDSPR